MEKILSMDLVSDTYKQTTNGCKWERKKIGFISIDPGKSIKSISEYAGPISEYIEPEKKLDDYSYSIRPLYRRIGSVSKTHDLRTSASLRGYIFESIPNIIASLDLKTFRNPRFEKLKRTGRIKYVKHPSTGGRLAWNLYTMYNKNGHITSSVPYEIPKKNKK